MGAIIRDLNRSDTFIDSVASVNKILKEEHQIDVKEWVVRNTMKEELGMSFKKVKPVSTHSNSDKNRVCRQQFALKFIELLVEGKTILNIDETWVGMCDYRRMKWQPAGSTNSVAKLQMQPRISMITGLDSKGHVYLSLLQSNTNGKVMEIFIHKLVKVLDQENEGWRATTVWLCDNAPYHVSTSTLNVFQALRIPVLFTGPHSYDAAPCELFFAHFKRADINPRKVKTGKS